MRKNTKEAILSAAISLFNTNGFSATSIRDIARKAEANVANIAYYFRNKNGLLEYCFTTFFENYLSELEKGVSSLQHRGATICLKETTERILQYQCKNIQLTRLVLREISIDTQIVREIMSTYFLKEKYYFEKIFEEGVRTKEFRPLSINYMIIQYKGLLTTPFLNLLYLSKVLQVFPNESFFAEKYFKEVSLWIDEVLRNKNKNEISLPALVVMK